MKMLPWMVLFVLVLFTAARGQQRPGTVGEGLLSSYLEHCAAQTTQQSKVMADRAKEIQALKAELKKLKEAQKPDESK